MAHPVPSRWPLFVVPHSHFDLIWRRPVLWYRRRRAEIYRAALDLLQARPDFRYSFCQAFGLQAFFRDCPRERARFRRFVREGRLEIIGGPVTIPDVNLSHGEAIARNQLMGLDWLQEHLGIRPAMACLEDTFGVPASLPALLRSCGMPFYRASRMPRPGRPDLNGPFHWTGHDGTVLPACGPEGMAWGLGQPSNVDAPPHDYAGMVNQYRCDLRACRWDGSRPVLFSLVGEEHVPTPASVDAFEEAIRSLRIPFRWATAAEFVAELRRSGALDRAPRVRDDFSRLFTGCYSSRIRQKARIAGLEASLLAAESVSAVAGRAGRAPGGEWASLFLLQFHDAYGGCHIPENARFMDRLLTRACARVERALAGPRLGNPLPFARALPFLVPSGLRAGGGRRVVAQELDGEPVANLPLPALTSVAVSVKVARPRRLTRARVLRGAGTNLRLDAKEARLMVHGRALPLPGLLRLREDVGTLWTEDYTGREWREAPGQAALERAEQGPLFSRAVWTGALRYGPGLWSGFTSLAWRRSLLLFRDSPLLWLRLELEWSGNSTEIGWSFRPLRRGPSRVHGSMPFGARARRAYRPGADGLTGDVFPSPHWAAVEDGTGAWLVLHRGHPAFRSVAGGLENVVLRSPVKRWMPFFPVAPDATAWENGRHVADFLLVPRRTFDPAFALHAGLAFQTGARAMRALRPPEELAQLLRARPAAVAVSSLARRGPAWRLRICETSGREVRWTFPAGWTGTLQPLAGGPPAAGRPEVRVPPRWLGDVWLLRGGR